jgi:hypothetical protein
MVLGPVNELGTRFFYPSWEGGVAAPTQTYNATSAVGAAGEVSRLGPTSPAAPITSGSVTFLDRRGRPLLARRGIKEQKRLDFDLFTASSFAEGGQIVFSRVQIAKRP